MKRLLLIAGLCTLTVAAHAQWLIGPELGVNVSNIRIKYPGIDITNRPAAGFRGGLLVIARADQQVSVLTGLTYYTLGSHTFVRQGNLFGAAYLLMHTLQLPVYVHLQAPKGAHGRFFIGAGFAADCHLSGKSYEGDESSELEIGSSTPDAIKRFDFAAGLDAGYRVANGLAIRAQYQLGLTNMFQVDPETWKARSFALTVAYLPSQRAKKPAKSK